MRIELRAGFCDPEGELLSVLDRPGWQRINIRRKREIVGQLVSACEERKVWEVEAWRRDGDAEPRHIIGYWHSPETTAAPRRPTPSRGSYNEGDVALEPAAMPATATALGPRPSSVRR
jgi:hypothetical protein